MSRNITGPWVFKGILNEVAGNSNTNHQSIIDFKAALILYTTMAAYQQMEVAITALFV